MKPSEALLELEISAMGRGEREEDAVWRRRRSTDVVLGSSGLDGEDSDIARMLACSVVCCRRVVRGGGAFGQSCSWKDVVKTKKLLDCCVGCPDRVAGFRTMTLIVYYPLPFALHDILLRADSEALLGMRRLLSMQQYGLQSQSRHALSSAGRARAHWATKNTSISLFLCRPFRLCCRPRDPTRGGRCIWNEATKHIEKLTGSTATVKSRAAWGMDTQCWHEGEMQSQILVLPVEGWWRVSVCDWFARAISYADRTTESDSDGCDDGESG
ncbi:hypothetical protein CPB85DRAFT_1247870 [Mucidula mucida]|nr:hypothetical protein CPB85DRAFT_1247870 [Mucidula mucida]